MWFSCLSINLKIICQSIIIMPCNIGTMVTQLTCCGTVKPWPPALHPLAGANKSVLLQPAGGAVDVDAARAEPYHKGHARSRARCLAGNLSFTVSHQAVWLHCVSGVMPSYKSVGHDLIVEWTSRSAAFTTI